MRREGVGKLSRVQGAAMYRTLNRICDVLARGLALAGGAVLLVLVFATCLSILGRAFVPLDVGLGPIRGIYDMTEIGMAAAVFAFLPWAQFCEAHARVDLFRWAISRKLGEALDVLFNAAMAFVAIVGTQRLYLGMQDKIAFGETTLIAQIPVWQGYAAALVGALGFVVIALFCTLRATRRFAGYEDVTG